MDIDRVEILACRAVEEPVPNPVGVHWTPGKEHKGHLGWAVEKPRSLKRPSFLPSLLTPLYSAYTGHCPAEKHRSLNPYCSVPLLPTPSYSARIPCHGYRPVGNPRFLHAVPPLFISFWIRGSAPGFFLADLTSSFRQRRLAIELPRQLSIAVDRAGLYEWQSET